MLKNSKIKQDLDKKSADLKQKKQPKKASEEAYGIPDGSDSEISDFDVDENGAGREDEDEEDEDDEFGDEEEEDLFGEKNGEHEDDIDSDEVDEDLVDLYTDLGELVYWNCLIDSQTLIPGKIQVYGTGAVPNSKK